MITARATLPAPTTPDSPPVIALLISMNGVPIKEHKATVSDRAQDPKTLSARWEAIANALIAAHNNLCDEMAREAWFASICQTEDLNLRHTADRARGIVSNHIGPERLSEIYRTAA